MIAQEGPRATNDKIRRHFFLFLILIPAIVYFWAFLRYSIDMPAGDDYDVILDWLHRFINSPDQSAKVHLLLEAQNEHRVVFDRLVVLANYLLLDRINFIYLDAVGAAGLFFIFALLMKLAIDSRLSVAQLVPIAFLTFNLRQWELLSFPMASIQQYWQLLFALLSIYTLHKRNERPLFFASSLTLAIFASFTGGGGLLVFPVGLLVLAYDKDWRAASIWSGFFILVFFIYFVAPGYHGNPISKDSHKVALEHPGQSIRYSLAFLASYVRTSNLAVTLGALTLALCLWLFFSEYRNRTSVANLSPLGFILYILLVAMAAGLSRASMGIDEALSSRYTIYSLALLAAIYVYISNVLATRTRRLVFSFTTLSVSLLIYFCYLPSSIAFLDYEQKLLERYLVYPYNGRAIEILGAAMRDKIFVPNATVFSNLPDETKAALVYKYPVPYSTNNAIPPPEEIRTIIQDRGDYSASWARLSKLYFGNMDLKLAFPLNDASSYIEFLTWAANTSYIEQSDRAIYQDLASMLTKARPADGAPTGWAAH